MRILSGIQPSGKLHLGNYFGMMKPALELQKEGQAFIFIADYHALTSVTDPRALRQGQMDVALDFLACGLDTDKTVFYRQSDIPEVTELAWLLSVVAPALLDGWRRELPVDTRGKQLLEEAISYYQAASEAYRSGALRTRPSGGTVPPAPTS